jgi:osmoprotectant transport system permease protein
MAKQTRPEPSSARVYLANLGKVALCAAAGVLLSLQVLAHPQDRLVARLVSGHKILALLGQHVAIVGISSALAVLLGVPAGILLTRTRLRAWAPRVVAVVNVGQTVPSLAVIALSVGILGIGARTAIIAMWIYSLLPILNNTLAGLREVDPQLIEAANGMGMRPRRVLLRVELPLALPMILAGIRTAVTINIGSAILAAFVGGGGLGNLIIAGNNISRTQVLVLGAGLPVLMALAADAFFEMLEHRTRFL